MPEATSYPQIPNTVWVGVWRLLHDSPSRKLDESVLSIELGVQKTASRQYLKELVRLGLLTDDGSATNLGKRWRQDGDDQSIINDILIHAYPSDLLEIAPSDRLDREKITRWFLGQGLGSGAANNKAATYIRVASGISAVESVRSTKGNEATGSSRSPASSRRTRRAASANNIPQVVSSDVVDDQSGGDSSSNGAGGVSNPRRPGLNVNVQVHISADSSSEQIDAIFSAMKRYFDGDETA